jgi:hypothetical protein
MRLNASVNPLPPKHLDLPGNLHAHTLIVIMVIFLMGEAFRRGVRLRHSVQALV